MPYVHGKNHFPEWENISHIFLLKGYFSLQISGMKFKIGLFSMFFEFVKLLV